MYRIGQFSELTAITISSLRYYERIGLLLPDRVDPQNNYCYYDNNSYLKAILITGMKEMGFTLNEIKVLIVTQDDDALYLAMKVKQAAITAEIHRLREVIGTVEDYLSNYERDEKNGLGTKD